MDPIVLSAIKKAKKEIVDLLNKIDGQTLQSMVLELRNTLSKLDTEKLSAGDFNQMMASIQEYFLIKLDASISSRADGKDWTAERAGKVDKLDVAVSSRLSKTDFDAVLADLKKSSAEYRDRIAAVLGQMDVAGLSNETALGLLTQYLEDIPIIGAASSTLTTQGGSYTIPRGYHNGKGGVKTDIANLRPENIKSGANVGGVVGTAEAKVELEVYEPKNNKTLRTPSNKGGTICYIASSTGGYDEKSMIKWDDKPINHKAYIYPNNGAQGFHFVDTREQSWNGDGFKKISQSVVEYELSYDLKFFIVRKYD